MAYGNKLYQVVMQSGTTLATAEALLNTTLANNQGLGIYASGFQVLSSGVINISVGSTTNYVCWAQICYQNTN